MFRWEEGRSGGGYKKLKLISFIFFDLFVLKIPAGSEIKPHRDPVEGKKHYRMNFIFPFHSGGKFNSEKSFINWPFLNFGRPDLHEHYVTPVTKGSRYSLSLGWVLKNRQYYH